MSTPTRSELLEAVREVTGPKKGECYFCGEVTSNFILPGSHDEWDCGDFVCVTCAAERLEPDDRDSEFDTNEEYREVYPEKPEGFDS